MFKKKTSKQKKQKKKKNTNKKTSDLSQLTFTRSKPTIPTIEKGVNYVES